MLLRNVGVYVITSEGKCCLDKYNSMPAKPKFSLFDSDNKKPEFAVHFEETDLFVQSSFWENQKILPKLNTEDHSIASYRDLETQLLPAFEREGYFYYCKYVDYENPNEKAKLKQKGIEIKHPGCLYVLACSRKLNSMEVFDLLYNLEVINLDGPDSLFILENMVRDPLRFVGKKIIIVDRKIEGIHTETNKTKDVLYEAMDRLKEREEMLAQLLESSENLLESTQIFRDSARRLNQGGCCDYASGAYDTVANKINILK
jgi:Synaptobrevin